MPGLCFHTLFTEMAGRSVLRSSDARSCLARFYAAGFLMEEL